VGAAKVRSQKIWEKLCAVSTEDSSGGPTHPAEPGDPPPLKLSLRPIAISFDDVPDDKSNVSLFHNMCTKRKAPSLQLQTLDFSAGGNGHDRRAIKRVVSRSKSLFKMKCRKHVWAGRLPTILEGREQVHEI
jgi:hypothetical protein